MSDPRAKHWLADDANFLATLGDLDRGLGGAGDDVPPTGAQDAAVAAQPTAPPPVPLGAPVQSGPRPLLDLFPEWALLPESAAAPSTPASPALRAPAGDSPRPPRPAMFPLRPEPAVPSQPTHRHRASEDAIDGALIEAAAADLDLQPGADGPGLLARLLIVAVFALLVLAGAAGALWTSRDAVNRTILQWEQIPLPPGGPVRRLAVPIAPIPPPDVIPGNLQRRPAI